jgi:hypothetical protein
VIDGILHGFYATSTPIDEVELDALVRKQLPYYSVPERWMRVDDVPLNANGKVDKARLKELVAELGMPTMEMKPVRSTHERNDSAFDTLVAPAKAVLRHPPFEFEDSATTVHDNDPENGSLAKTFERNAMSETTEPFDGDYRLPDPMGSPIQAWIRHRGLIAYRWLLILIVLANIGVACWLLDRYIKRREYPLSSVATATASNLSAAILIRSEPVINLLFKIFSNVPTWTPIGIRRICANVFHIGGIHVGCAIAAVIWFVLFVVGTSLELAKSADVRTVSVATTVLSYLVLLLLLAITSLSYPTFRNKHHDLWESLHRFGGWTVLILYWVLVGLSTRDLIHASGASISEAYLRNPTIWLIAIATCAIIFPWISLRRVPVQSEVLSPHAIRLHFDSEIRPGKGVRLALHPLRDWHGFATITHAPKAKGYSVIVSRAGDFTGHIIDNPPTHIWRRGIPTSGVLRIATLFKSVVIVATGSGIGPCLSIFPYQHITMRILWTAPNHEATFGKDILETVKRRDPKANMWNTRMQGKPDMSLLTWRLYKESGAEAVLVISNKRFTKQIVFDMERRGIPAYGAIFDS